MDTEVGQYVIAIVEDEESLRVDVERFLEGLGYRVWGCPSAEIFYRQLAVQHADLVIVDLGLPGEGGLSLISHLQGVYRHGIIAISEHGAVEDRIAGLEAGADQYFVKPMDLRELVAGIKAVLRCRRGAASTPPSSLEVRHADMVSKPWRMDLHGRILYSPAGGSVDLTGRESDLLGCLMQAPFCMISKASLLSSIGADPLAGDFHRVETLLSRLRKKVESSLGLPLPIRAVFGKGLVFVAHCKIFQAIQ